MSSEFILPMIVAISLGSVSGVLVSNKINEKLMEKRSKYGIREIFESVVLTALVMVIPAIIAAFILVKVFS